MPPQQGEFAHIQTTLLLNPDPDVRDRTTNDYREWFDRLCKDVAENGIMVPVVAYKDRDGKYRVCDGWTRVLAALMNRLGVVPAIVYDAPPTAADRALASTKANLLRHDMSDKDKAAQLIAIMREKGWSQAELCRRLNLDKSGVCRLLKRYTALPEDILNDVGGPIPARAGDALARLKDFPDQLRAYAEEMRRGAWSVDTLEEKVHGFLHGTRPKPPPRPRPREFKDGPVTLQYPADMTGDQLADKLVELAKKFRKGA